MPLDPQAKMVLDQMAAMGAPPLGSVPAAQARAAMKNRPAAPGPAVYRTEDRFVAGPAGAIPIRVYTPVGTGPFPALVWFHGGGWVLGDLAMADGTARHLCLGAGTVVVSVDYRLAPEHKFPAASDDCYAATEWTAKNAQWLNVDVRKIAVGGDSAGGNLAAAVALMARDKKGPKLASQLLIYPVTNWDFSTKSYSQNADGYLLTKNSMVWFWDQYLGKPSDIENPYAAPAKARSLRGLPPALVITAEFDPLRDEGNDYAKKLQAAGVTAVNTTYPGMIHGFFGMSAIMTKAKQAVDQANGFLRQSFAGQRITAPAAAPARATRSRASAPARATRSRASAPVRASRTAAPARGRAKASAKPAARPATRAAARPAGRSNAAAPARATPARGRAAPRPAPARRTAGRRASRS